MFKLKLWKQKMQYFVYSRKISTKMSVLMITVITLALFCSVFTLQTYNKQILYKNTQEAANTNLTSFHKLVENTIESVNTYSYICLSSSAVQQGLEKEEDAIADFRNIEKIEASLTELIAKIDLIESIYIYDKEELLCYSDKSGNYPLLHHKIQDYSWFDDVEDNGKYHVLYHCQELFSSPDKIPGISFIRAIRSLDSMKTIGYMVINISQEMVDSILLDLDENEFQMKYHVFSEENHILMSTIEDSCQEEIENIGWELIKENKNSVMKKIDDDKDLVSVYQTEDLIYMGVIPMDGFHQQERENMILVMGLFVVQAVIIIIAALGVSHWYTRPIKKLMESMDEVKKGRFRKIQIHTSHYEIQNLITGYNEMMGEIEKLLEKTKQAERQKRKADLEVLSVQMNPHFLYNTFDSIKSLFLLKQYEDAYHMMSALAQFYKISLSKGDEYITIEKEVQMVANYVEIQKMRYGEELQVAYEVEPDTKEYKILKFVLQPLVENSISHGIHGFVKEGMITVRIKKEDGFLCLAVEDNGIGMSERTLASVLNGESAGNIKSFGLIGTMRRLSFCYGEGMTYQIVSRIHQGTQIRIYIPMGSLQK